MPFLCEYHTKVITARSNVNFVDLRYIVRLKEMGEGKEIGKRRVGKYFTIQIQLLKMAKAISINVSITGGGHSPGCTEYLSRLNVAQIYNILFHYITCKIIRKNPRRDSNFCIRRQAYRSATEVFKLCLHGNSKVWLG